MLNKEMKEREKYIKSAFYETVMEFPSLSKDTNFENMSERYNEMYYIELLFKSGAVYTSHGHDIHELSDLKNVKCFKGPRHDEEVKQFLKKMESNYTKSISGIGFKKNKSDITNEEKIREIKHGDKETNKDLIIISILREPNCQDKRFAYDILKDTIILSKDFNEEDKKLYTKNVAFNKELKRIAMDDFIEKCQDKDFYEKIQKNPAVPQQIKEELSLNIRTDLEQVYDSYKNIR